MKIFACLKSHPLLLAACVLVFAAFPSAAHAAPSGKLIFTAYPDDGEFSQIFLIDPDGSHETQIVHPGINNYDASPSPDGSRFVFKGDYLGYDSNLVVMNADGTNVTTIPGTSAFYSPVWSPDGARIAAGLNGSELFDSIVTLNADGSNVQTVAFSPYSPQSLNWSPDGKKIVYTADFGIYEVNVDGMSAPVHLAGGNTLRLGDYDTPVWSPDGTKIAASLTTDHLTTHDALVLLDATTGAVTPLPGPDDGGIYGIFASFSPDGTSLAYTIPTVDARVKAIYFVKLDSFEISSVPTSFPPVYLRWEAVSGGAGGSTNLLANGDAEASAGAPDFSTVSQPTGWTIVGNLSAVRYDATGVTGVLTPTDATSLGGGVNYFAGGPDSGDSVGTQQISVAARATEIDGGQLTAVASGLFGGFGTQNDAATLSVQFQDANGAPLGSFSTGNVLAADRQNVTALLPKAAQAAVPAGTRSLLVTLTMHRTDGSYNDAYADNLSVTLNSSTGTTVTVPGTASIFLASEPAGSITPYDDVAPAQSPVLVTGLSLTAGLPLTFDVTGTTSQGGGIAALAADGSGFGSDSSYFPANGLSGLRGVGFEALVGVFVDDTVPSTNGPAPDTLDYSAGVTPAGGPDYSTFQPAVRQVFFIGDGKDSQGNTQTILAPPGATRLFLGLGDSGNADNSGQLTVVVHGGTTPPPVTGAVLAVNDDDFTYSTKKSANTGTVVPGDTITYSLTVRNKGAAPATNVVVKASFDSNNTKLVKDGIRACH